MHTGLIGLIAMRRLCSVPSTPKNCGRNRPKKSCRGTRPILFDPPSVSRVVFHCFSKPVSLFFFQTFDTKRSLPRWARPRVTRSTTPWHRRSSTVVMCPKRCGRGPGSRVSRDAFGDGTRSWGLVRHTRWPPPTSRGSWCFFLFGLESGKSGAMFLFFWHFLFQVLVQIG